MVPKHAEKKSLSFPLFIPMSHRSRSNKPFYILLTDFSVAKKTEQYNIFNDKKKWLCSSNETRAFLAKPI